VAAGSENKPTCLQFVEAVFSRKERKPRKDTYIICAFCVIRGQIALLELVGNGTFGG
jgi:hypothetical protein